MPPADSPLRALNEQLALPTGIRSRIIREIRGDLESLVEQFLGAGYPAERAVDEAARLLVPTGGTTAELEAMHRPWYARITARYPTSSVRRAERVGLGVMTVLAGTALALPLATSRGAFGSPWLVPVLAMACLVLGHWSWFALRAFARRDVESDALRRGSAIQAGLVATTLSLSALAAVSEIYVATAAWEVGSVSPSPAHLVARVSALAALGLGTGIFGVFAWLTQIRACVHLRKVETELNGLLRSLHPNVE